MRYKFNDTFLGLGYIKELLHEFNLPKCQVATDDTILYDSSVYVKDLGIYRCVEGELIKLSDYYFNKPVLNLTTNMSITKSYYGSDIHEYLGNYLRFLRDYKHINLMSLYNCFSNRVIFPKRSDSYLHEQDKNYNYYAIPVRFGQNYTIGLDTSIPIEVYCTLWDEVEIDLNGSTTGEDPRLTRLKTLTSITINSCDMTRPFIYTKLKDLPQGLVVSDYINHFGNLKLVLRVPRSNSTSIVVLEGSYGFDTVIDGVVTTSAEFGQKEDKYHFKDYPTDLSLLKVNDKQQHPFADRLMEYLLDTAVTNVDILDDNIKRVQEFLIYLENYKIGIVYGDWDETMNDNIYKLVNNSHISRYGAQEYERYIKSKTNVVNSEGGEWLDFDYKNLKDVAQDLLMYVDKDVEALFLATEKSEYEYTR